LKFSAIAIIYLSVPDSLCLAFEHHRNAFVMWWN